MEVMEGAPRGCAGVQSSGMRGPFHIQHAALPPALQPDDDNYGDYDNDDDDDIDDKEDDEENYEDC